MPAYNLLTFMYRWPTFDNAVPSVVDFHVLALRCKNKYPEDICRPTIFFSRSQGLPGFALYLQVVTQLKRNLKTSLMKRRF